MRTRSQNGRKEVNALFAKVFKSTLKQKSKFVKLKKLINDGANINYQDTNGNTLLHLAEKSTEVALLLKLGADASIQNIVGETALLRLIKRDQKRFKSELKKHFKKTKFIIREFFKHFGKNKSVYVNIKDFEANTPLFEYVRRNECNLAVVKQLVDMGASLDIQCLKRNSLLHVAVYNPFCKVDVVKYLLEKGLDPNAVNFYRETPLHHSLKRKNLKLDIIEELVKYRANVMVRNSRNNTPLLMAVLHVNCNKNLLEILLKGVPCSIDIVSHINEKLMCWAGPYGGTLLHAAMQHGNLDVIETLLVSGAEVNAIDKGGLTPLLRAVSNYNCDERIVHILVKYGADVNIRNRYNNSTALHLAFATTGNVDVVKTLLHYKANMCVLDRRRYTPFHYLLSNQNMDVPFLIELLSTEESICACLQLTATESNFLSLSTTSICKTVLKYLILKYHQMIDEGKLPLIIDVFFSKLNNVLKQIYTKFYRACLAEIEEMKGDRIWDDISFYEVMAHEFSQITSHLENEVKQVIIDAVLVRITSDQYPIYKDMVIYVRKQDFLKNLDAVRISTIVVKNSSKKKIFLDQFVVRNIADYLSKQDVINLILAYSNCADDFSGVEDDTIMDEKSTGILDKNLLITREVKVNLCQLSQKELKKLCKPCTVDMKNSTEIKMLINQ